MYACFPENKKPTILKGISSPALGSHSEINVSFNTKTNMLRSFSTGVTILKGISSPAQESHSEIKGLSNAKTEILRNFSVGVSGTRLRLLEVAALLHRF